MQVLAWVHLGDRSLVSRYEDDKDLTQLHLVDEAEDRGTALFRTVQDAIDAVRRKLETGELVALGLEYGTGSHECIPNAAWAGMQFFFGPIHAAPKRSGTGSGYFRPRARHWYDLKFLRADVIKLWPTEMDDTDGCHDETPLVSNEITRADKIKRLYSLFNEAAGKGGCNLSFERGARMELYRRLAKETGYSEQHVSRELCSLYDEFEAKRTADKGK